MMGGGACFRDEPLVCTAFESRRAARPRAVYRKDTAAGINTEHPGDKSAGGGDDAGGVYHW